MHFEIVGEVSQVETIASGRAIRRLKFLRKRYGGRNWRKRKGIAMVRLANGSTSAVTGKSAPLRSRFSASTEPRA
jgi:hypothetical protein